MRKKYWGLVYANSLILKFAEGCEEMWFFTAVKDSYLDEGKVKSEKWICSSVSNNDYFISKFKYGRSFSDILELTAGFNFKV